MPLGWEFLSFSGSREDCLLQIAADGQKPTTLPRTVIPNPTKVTATPFLDPEAVCRLFVFPHAGSGASYYHFLARSLRESSVEVRLIQYPGREMRVQESAIESMEIMTELLRQELTPQLTDRPFAFLGHSMGALIAFELSRLLRTTHSPLPGQLFLSGRLAPQLSGDILQVGKLSDAEFLAAIGRRYNAIPTQILEHPEILELILPSLRADFQLMEEYKYRPAPPLDIPITLLNGIADSWVSPESLNAWQDQTTLPLQQHLFPGDHFYLNQSVDALGKILLREFRPPEKRDL